MHGLVETGIIVAVMIAIMPNQIADGDAISNGDNGNVVVILVTVGVVDLVVGDWAVVVRVAIGRRIDIAKGRAVAV